MGRRDTHTRLQITEAQRRQYVEDGYFILERALPQADLELLRSECENMIDGINAEMDRAGTDILGLNHRNSRYFIANAHVERPRLRAFLHGEVMSDVCRATLGDEAYLFFEQYVIKCAEKGLTFSWHQDSGYIDYDHMPYVSCWIPLDDVNEENGTVYILPFSRAGVRERIEHTLDAATNDRVGYAGDDPGVPITAPAGSVVVFSSVTLHRSGANTTDRMRRVYLAQYSAEPMPNADGSGLLHFAEPVLKAGERVPDDHV